jgi:hypothetical protein
MTDNYPQILPVPDVTSWIPQEIIPRFTASDLAERTEALKMRIAELETELAWYRSTFGHITDGEIQTIISNL